MSALREELAESLPDLKEELADPVSYTHRPGGTVQSVDAIIKPGTKEAVFPGKHLVMKFFVADLSPYPAQGDEVTYSGSMYKVADVDGKNGVTVTLSLRKSA